MTDQSLAFDRAVEYYDETRALPPTEMAAVVELLIGELSGRGRVLEVGVGTGRIALPLAGAGVDVTGADLSVPMMQRLLAKSADAGAVVPVARADATRLPVASASVGASYVCHVLHLIPDWRAAVAELVRVVRPGGVVLVDHGGPLDQFAPMAEHFQSILGLERRHRGADHQQDAAAVAGAFAEVGASERPLPPVHTARDLPPSALISMWEQNRFSWLWSFDEDVRLGAVEATKAWAVEHYGGLDVPVHLTADIVWRAFDLR